MLKVAHKHIIQLLKSTVYRTDQTDSSFCFLNPQHNNIIWCCLKGVRCFTKCHKMIHTHFAIKARHIYGEITHVLRSVTKDNDRGAMAVIGGKPVLLTTPDHSWWIGLSPGHGDSAMYGSPGSGTRFANKLV